ncbi:MAG TPA: hypothetical protein VGM88_25595 [Kofleriaceae bacterium]|jgi:hypothetical protein
MPLLAALSVFFVGVVGGDHRVETQVQGVFHGKDVVVHAVPAPDLRTLARRGEGYHEIVTALGADGAVAGEVLTTDGHASLRIIVYGADGSLKTLSEVPLQGGALTHDQQVTLAENLASDVDALLAAAPDRTRSPVVAEAPVVAAPPVVAPPVAAPPVVAPPVVAEASADDGAVSVAELEGLSSSAPEAAVAASAPSAAYSLHARATVGFGMVGRSFSPGPSAIAPYSSSAVGAVRVAGSVQPTARIALDASIERTLGMTTSLGGAAASTAIARWEISGTYAVVRGPVDIGPELGIGRRSFHIDSIDPGRTPDDQYQYLMLGLAAQSALGTHVRVRAAAVFEPVLGGTDDMAMAYGGARRWAFDVGAALELRPISHLVVRLAADYQRFSWSWSAAGTRGAGGAADAYPTGTLAIGAEY